MPLEVPPLEPPLSPAPPFELSVLLPPLLEAPDELLPVPELAAGAELLPALFELEVPWLLALAVLDCVSEDALPEDSVDDDSVEPAELCCEVPAEAVAALC